MALRVAHGVEGLVDCARLAALSDLVARESGRPLPVQKPVVGAAAFLHASGIHCAGQLRDEQCYEAFGPTLVGRERPAFVLGGQTGGAALREAEAGVHAGEALVGHLHAGVELADVAEALARLAEDA